MTSSIPTWIAFMERIGNEILNLSNSVCNMFAIYIRTFFSYICYGKFDPVYSVFCNMRNSCAHNTRFSPFSSANVINCITRRLTHVYLDYKLHRIRYRMYRNATNECFQSRRFRESSIPCVQIFFGREILYTLSFNQYLLRDQSVREPGNVITFLEL